MIKHNLKLKGQTTQKSLFYLTRRVVTSRVGTVVKSTATTQQHYRSASTTPSKFRVSQNIDEGTRQQSTSINSAEILSQIKSHRVLSMFQQFDTVREEPKRSISNVVVKQNTQDLSEIDIPMNHKIKTRKQIFKNQTFQDYKKLQKFKKQETTTKWMFVQKVLKNIKVSQGEKSEQKQLTRKYSNVWKEGFQLTFPEQQKFAKSQTQLRLYINQYIEKIMNKKRIYNYNVEQLALICYDGLRHNKMHVTNIMRQFYIENHNIKLSTEVEVEEEQFRYSKDIKSYEFMYKFI